MIANVPLNGMGQVGYMGAAAAEGFGEVIECLWVSEQ